MERYQICPSGQYSIRPTAKYPPRAWKSRSRVVARLQAQRRVKKQIQSYAPNVPEIKADHTPGQKNENSDKTKYKSSRVTTS